VSQSLEVAKLIECVCKHARTIKINRQACGKHLCLVKNSAANGESLKWVFGFKFPSAAQRVSVDKLNEFRGRDRKYKCEFANLYKFYCALSRSWIIRMQRNRSTIWARSLGFIISKNQLNPLTRIKQQRAFSSFCNVWVCARVFIILCEFIRNGEQKGRQAAARTTWGSGVFPLADYFFNLRCCWRRGKVESKRFDTVWRASFGMPNRQILTN
jgi:hypothetical protein